MTLRKKRGAKRPVRYRQEAAKRALAGLLPAEQDLLKDLYRAALAAYPATTRAALDRYLVYRYRASGKAARDAAKGRDARKLVGARIPREAAEQVRRAAEATGRSVYRLVLDALQAEIGRTGRGPLEL